MNGEGVNYTVKELLERQDKKLDTILLKLENKAERQAVHELSGRLSALELTALRTSGPMVIRIDKMDERLNDLERAQAGSVALSGWQRWFFGTVVVALIGAIATLIWLATG